MPRPTRYQVALEIIRQRIANGMYHAGQRLPTEVQLCREFEMSRTCIRKALAQLKNEALIVAEHGNGHFVGSGHNASCADTVLIMPINFAGWDIENSHCLLYSLFEQHVIHHGCRFTHIQLAEGGTAESLARQVESCAAPWVVIDLQAHSVLRSDALLWHLLEDLSCRIVVTGFVGSSYTTTFDQVGTDWAAGTRQAVDYLIGRGHRRILFAGLDGVDWSDDRRAAFLAALRRRGRWDYAQPMPYVPFNGNLHLNDFRRPPVTAYEAVAANLVERLKSQPADAVICANDQLAMNVVALAPRATLPELVAFDNSRWSKEHGVTSVGMDLRRHADTVFELLAQPAKPTTQLVRVPTLLSVR